MKQCKSCGILDGAIVQFNRRETVTDGYCTDCRRRGYTTAVPDTMQRPSNYRKFLIVNGRAITYWQKEVLLTLADCGSTAEASRILGKPSGYIYSALHGIEKKFEDEHIYQRGRGVNGLTPLGCEIVDSVQ